jgi:hypothetical protein
MSQPDTGARPQRVFEPTAVGPGVARRDDWRGVGLAPELEAARDEARAALGRALASDPPRDGAAWAAAELAVYACLDRALDRLYAALGAPRPPPGALLDDLAGRESAVAALVGRALTAPDARTRYVFLEDLLARLPS